MKNLLPLIALIPLFIALNSCSDKKSNVIGDDTYSSPKSLYVDYISSYTSGIISRKSEIKVRFAKNIEGVKAGERLSGEVFSFSPKIDGTTIWEDQRTLVFKPSAYLLSGTKYEAAVRIDKFIQDVPKDRATFKFVFQPLVQNFEVKIIRIQPYTKTNLKSVKLIGTVQTADFASNESVEKKYYPQNKVVRILK